MINSNFKKILLIPIFILSFLFCIKNTYAVQQMTFNNTAYNNYFNFHSLEFSNNAINKRYYQYFKNIDFNIYDNLPNEAKILLENKKWFISFSSFYNSLSTFEYDLSSTDTTKYPNGYGLDFYIIYIDNQVFDDNKPFIEYNNEQIHLKNIYDPKHNTYKFIKLGLSYDPVSDIFSYYQNIYYNLGQYYFYIQDLSSYDLKYKYKNLGSLNADIFTSVFYQSNFYINYEDNELSIPFSADLINLNQSGLYQRYSDRPFLGGDTLSNMLLLGDGQPLYAGYDYFTGNFNYGKPYTNDYDRVYLYGNTNCYLKANNDYFNSTESEKILYVKYSNILSSSTDKLFIARYNNIADFNEFVNYDDPPSNVLVKSYDTSTLLSKKDFIKPYIPLTDNDDILEFAMSRNNLNMSNSLVIYYNKNIYQYSCIVDDNTDEVAFIDGSTYIKGDRVGSNSIVDKLNNIYTFLLNMFNQIKTLFSKIANGFITLGGYIQGIFEDLLTFTSSFTFIGASITLFFSQMPVIFIAFFTIAFTITILGIIIKVIL